MSLLSASSGGEHNAGNDVRRVLTPFAATAQLFPWRVEEVVVDTPNTIPWYRLIHTKFHAWALPCRRVVLTDYDGIPLRSLDAAFTACDRALVEQMPAFSLSDDGRTNLVSTQ